MRFQELLPVGSVVLLKKGQKKIVIMGIMQMKHIERGVDIAYDYMGVPYPEGYMGQETALLFNHENIQEIIFKGFVDTERELFVKAIQQIIDKAGEKLSQ